MTSIELIEKYAIFSQNMPANPADIEAVVSIVDDICTRISRVPDVSQIELSFLAEVWRVRDECE